MFFWLLRQPVRAARLSTLNRSGRGAALGHKSRPGLGRFFFAIFRRRVGLKRAQQIPSNSGDILHGSLERCLVGFGWLVEPSNFSHELQRSRPHLVRSHWWLKIVKCLDISAHGRLPLSVFYSERNASTASTPAARIAGTAEASTPASKINPAAATSGITPGN